MKIFYAIQATGNGHISRAMEIMPYLKKYGEVDVFLSGSNSSLQFDLPVKYTSVGVSLFYGNKGGLDYLKMLQSFHPHKVWKTAKNLPLEQYDIILNDFESITAYACSIKKIPSLSFGHQASFVSPLIPRPEKKDRIGEWVLKNYAKATQYVGLHFKNYDKGIYNPILKEAILQGTPKEQGHITVYLSHYSDELVAKHLKAIKWMQFQVFSKTKKEPRKEDNILFIPVSKDAFNKSVINSSGVITGAGFETPAEVLYLGKRLMSLPICGQYEQWCNAAALKDLGVTIVDKIDLMFATKVNHWLHMPPPPALIIQNSTAELVEIAVEKAFALRYSNNINETELTKEDCLVLA